MMISPCKKCPYSYIRSQGFRITSVHSRRLIGLDSSYLSRCRCDAWTNFYEISARRPRAWARCV